MGKATVTLLQGLGFESIYQEVLCPWSACCDIVATRGPLLVAVECKRTLTFEVMHQAVRWIPYVHHSYVAFGGSHWGVDPLERRLLEDLGLGAILVQDVGTTLDMDAPLRADVILDPRWHHRPEPRLRNVLREEHKTYAAAGSSGVPRWSPFKATAQELGRYVVAHPGCSLKEAVENIRTHYRTKSTARSSLAQWIEKGTVEGVRLEREEGVLRLYPAEKPQRTA